LDERTKYEMSVPRCAFPDYITENTARSKRYILGKQNFIINKLVLIKETHFFSSVKKFGNRAILFVQQVFEVNINLAKALVVCFYLSGIIDFI